MDRIPQPFDHQLTDEQLKMIGLISVNWGSSERILRSTTIMLDKELIEKFTPKYNFHTYGFIGPTINRLKKLADQFKERELAIGIIENIEYCLASYKDMRNVVLHGAPFLNIDDKHSMCRLVFKMGDGRSVSVDQLDLMVEQSKYLLSAALNLFHLAHGQETKEMPPRPRTQSEIIV